MKIVINTRLLLRGKLDGIGWFSYETLRRIVKAHPEHEFIFLFDRTWTDEFIFGPNVRPVVLQPPARHPFLWYAWFEYSVHRFLKREKPAVFLSPDGYIPLRSKTPCISIIHDINFLHRPHDLPLLSRWYYNRFFPEFARRARIVGTVSEYSAGDIASNYGIERSSIKVVYNGANEKYAPLDTLSKQTTREKYTGGQPFFIFVGTMHPRKNIPNLLRAFDLFREKNTEPFRMVLVGSMSFLTGEIDQVLRGMKHREDVVFTGRLEPADLHRLMASAEALVFVPFIEGFGIPMVEAMRCAVPVIASDATSLPEIAANAALYVSPHEPVNIAEAMHRLISEPGLKDNLSARGLERSRFFSWDKSATELWELIITAANA